ncbi:hypothetical protein GPECTOR_2g1321 [Gonium pectorale]|uniref:Protein kinase domain-containing protein n=1 Tax=Gonium pectorale TaxID=33097 RepID=A0A150H108_GONPE|nr:hypothetical protein GPECTOR_2g1321 [Gonium pectorale]|eukprot:KXZ55771.1 hypothetical protein GPECTOR_2g1321 [Gonium pectorale]
MGATDTQRLLAKLASLGKSDDWVHDAVWALRTSNDDVKLGVLQASKERAVALVDELLKRAGDTTAAYLKACLTPFDGNKLRQGVDLSCLEEPLNPRLPVPWRTADALFNERADLRSLLVSAAEEPQAATAHRLCQHVGGVLTFQPGDGTSDVYTALSTFTVVERTLMLLRDHVPGPHIRMDRNGTDTSRATGERLRPDFMCWVDGALLLKGEETAPEADMGAAVEQLRDRLSVAWDEGLLPGVQPPCMLGYAAAGHKLQFFCIKRLGGASKPLVRVWPISCVMDLRTPVGRAGALNATCNAYRLMAGFAMSLTAVRPCRALGEVVKCGGSSVTLLQGFVRKTIRQFTTHHAAYATFELLQAVYAAVSKPEHRSSIVQACGPGSDGGPALHRAADDDDLPTYVVHLAPVGAPVSGPPGTERELAQAVRGALTGLAALHSEGFVHRDVRWPNLVKLPDDGRWLLVDLEHAGREGDDCSQPPYPLRHWGSDTLAPNGAYTAASDLKMLAQQLLAAVPFRLGGQGSDLRQRLCDGAVSAADALRHEWFELHA